MTFSVITFESKPTGLDVRVGWTDELGATDEEKRLAEGMAKVLKDLIASGIIQSRVKGGAK